MKTIDQVKIRKLIEEYKTDFKENISVEIYKWEAVKHFQDNWDVNAEDFSKMLIHSLSKTENLLTSMSHFARGMIVQFAERFPEEVKALFIALFDESKNLKGRIDNFIASIEQIHKKWDGKEAKSHFQTLNAISTYLWLRYPDKYYIYKPSVASRLFEEFGLEFKSRALKSDAMIKAYELYDRISIFLNQDIELKKLLSSSLSDTCYPDSQLRTTTTDFGYYFSKNHVIRRRLHTAFLENFPFESLSHLPLERYTNLDRDSFCYWLETKTNNLGSISGGSSYKFGIYQYVQTPTEANKFVVSNNKYAWYKRYDKDNADDAYLLVRDAVVKIATYAKEGRIDDIDKIDILGDVVKWKIAFIYSNATLIPIYNRDMLAFCAAKKGMDNTKDAKIPDLQRYLLAKKGDQSIFIWWDELTKLVEEYNKSLGNIKSLAESIKENINEEFEVGKIGNKYIWIETGDKCIGNNKAHYELCADGNEKAGHKKGYIYVEAHFETSDSSLFHSLENIEGVHSFPWGKDAAQYAVRINDEGWEIRKFETKELTTILIEEIIKLDNTIGEDIRRIMVMKTEQTAISKYDEKYEQYIKLLTKNKNLIFNGAPGTGKTYLAKQVAAQIIYEGNIPEDFEEDAMFTEQCGFVQFHPSYDYTDFVEGLRPIQDITGDVGFERRNGIFKEFCSRALQNFLDSKKTIQALQKELSVRDLLEGFIEESMENGTIFETSGTKNAFRIINNKEKSIIVRIPANEKTSEISLPKSDLTTLLENKVDIKGGGDIQTYFKRKYRTQSDSYIYVLYNALVKRTLPLTNIKNVALVPEKKFVFIIDEINRGEISKIFGELFFSIDPGYRGKKGKVQTQYQNLIGDDDPFKEGFYIPENVYIIGTMNDIDRSVECMDFAMRRRFTFKEITAEESALNMELNAGATERMKSLNNAISEIDGFNSSFHIGAAYFKGVDDYNELWELKLQGLLKEYLRGMPDAEESLEALKKAYNLSKE